MTNQSHAWDRFAPTTSMQSQPSWPTFAEPEISVVVPPADRVVSGEVIASSDAETPRQTSRIEVGRDGSIQFHDETAPTREPLTQVTTDTFYASTLDSPNAGSGGLDRVSTLTCLTLAVDLNKLRDALVTAQEENGGQPTDPNKQIYVGREGELLMGDEAGGAERIAQVTTDTFYAFHAQSRVEEESEFVCTNMPRNTVRVSDGTYDGWAFTISNEFGDTYKLFMYHHPSFGVYRVVLVDPHMEGGVVDAHGTHLWPDGHLCLTREHPGNGYPSMAQTYAKTAVWTRGASCYRRGYGFQFNKGQV
jgi:hypothetical protein